MSRLRQNLVKNFQMIVFTITYSLSWVLLYSIVMLLTKQLDIIFNVLITLSLLILGVVSWSYLNILFSIPHRLAGAFDPLKNRVSSGETTDVQQFSLELTAFLTSFFNYSFFDIRYSLVQTNEEKPVWSDEPAWTSEQVKSALPWDEIARSASASKDIQYNGRIRIDNKSTFAYTIPLWFDDVYLGYFTVFTMQTLGPLRKNILADLENNHIDDQIVRLIQPGSSQEVFHPTKNSY